MKILRLILITIIFIAILSLFYFLFLNKINYNEETILKNYNYNYSNLEKIFKQQNENNSIIKNLEIQRYIAKFFEENHIYSLNNESNFLTDFEVFYPEFEKDPELILMDNNRKIIKKYSYKIDFNIDINRFSRPLSAIKKGFTVVDPSYFNPKKNDLLLISSVYYLEQYDSTLFNSGVSALITDKPKNIVQNNNNIFFIPIKSSTDNFQNTSNGFCKIYVTPEIFSELASYIYKGYLLKIESNWNLKKAELKQNIALIPGKIKDDLIILEIPVSDDLNTIALGLTFLNILNSNKKNLIRPVIFFFSTPSTYDFTSEINFISSFKKFPKNTTSIILENIDGKEVNIQSFITLENKKKLYQLIKDFTNTFIKNNIKYSIDLFNTENRHFPYIHNKILSISLSTNGENITKNDIEKNIIESISKIIYDLITKIPFIYKLFFILIIVIFLILFFLLYKMNDKRYEK